MLFLLAAVLLIILSLNSVCSCSVLMKATYKVRFQPSARSLSPPLLPLLPPPSSPKVPVFSQYVGTEENLSSSISPPPPPQKGTKLTSSLWPQQTSTHVQRRETNSVEGRGRVELGAKNLHSNFFGSWECAKKKETTAFVSKREREKGGVGRSLKSPRQTRLHSFPVEVLRIIRFVYR